MGQQEVEYPFFDHVGDCGRCFRAATVLKNDLDAFCVEGLVALSKKVPHWETANGRRLNDVENVKEIERRIVLEQLSRIE